MTTSPRSNSPPARAALYTTIAQSRAACAVAVLLLLAPCSARAAEFDGAQLSGFWAAPFAGLLLSIALCPLLVPSFWHRHFGKVAAGWSLAFLLPFTLLYGANLTVLQVAHTLILEYTPFILVLYALYTIAGGIRIHGSLQGSPGTNTVLLGIGTLLASWMGTTGAAMLMIRPVIRANDNRQHKVHVIVFFIFLVANAGGSLTPLGDPPLFLGFLKGVDFFWTTRHLLAPTLVLCTVLLVVFYAIDSYYFRRPGEKQPAELDPTPMSRIGVDGAVNFAFLAIVLAGVLLSGFWDPKISWTVLGAKIELQNVVRDVIIVAAAFLSLAYTSKDTRERNHFTWGPILEVAKLFIAIFITIIPVIAMLRAGTAGAFARTVNLVTGPDGQPREAMYFWLSGALSSFLDNAPTYLVFFNMAGGDATELMTTLAPTLVAISAGSVFMGAVTYIGNAPNFMVKAIAEHRGIKMPSFLGYMGWSLAILMPAFLLITVIFFR